jgi:hypothetical protein
MSVCLPAGLRTWVATSWPWWKNCTVAWVSRASSRWPIDRQGIEYKVLPTLAWMSGPTLAVD